MNDEFSYLPFRKELVKRAYDTIRSILPPDLKKKKLFILTDGYEISELIPFADNRKRFEIHCERPIVSPIKCHYLPTKVYSTDISLYGKVTDTISNNP